MKVVLSIAGSDSSGGAGIQADLKTMTAHGVYGMTAITALTAQNTTGVTSIMESTPEFLGEQIEVCLSDIPADAVKIGMLPNAEQVKVVAEKIRKYDIKNLVLDPVMVATSGASLSKNETVELMTKLLFPMARVITPNIPETEKLTGNVIKDKSDMEKSARVLGEKYGCSVLVKGGHSIEDACDVLWQDGEIIWFETSRIDNDNTHGTGCTLSSAIASNLALNFTLEEAIRRAKDFISACIGDGLNLGKGSGPLNHMVGINSKGEKDGSNKWERIRSSRQNCGECNSGIGI